MKNRILILLAALSVALFAVGCSQPADEGTQATPPADTQAAPDAGGDAMTGDDGAMSDDGAMTDESAENPCNPCAPAEGGEGEHMEGDGHEHAEGEEH